MTTCTCKIGHIKFALYPPFSLPLSHLRFCEEDIDQILERHTQVIQLESEGKGSTFSKASFVSDGATDIHIDDPEFWQKWAKKANLNLDQLAKKVRLY